MKTTLAILLLLQAGLACGALHTVLPDGSGDFPSIAAAMEAAEDGDVIELGKGIFTGEGNRNLDFQGKQLVIRSQGGDPSACVIDCEELGRGFLLLSGESGDCALEGLTITRGRAHGELDEDVGAAVYCRVGASPRITNCVFSHNSSSYCGAAVTLAHDASPVILDCVFTDNATEGWGAALTILADSYPVIRDCLFRDNAAAMAGGAVLVSNDSAPTFEGCTFDGNESLNGGAVECQQRAFPLIQNCTFHDNRATSLDPASGSGSTAPP